MVGVGVIHGELAVMVTMINGDVEVVIMMHGDGCDDVWL